MSYPLRRDTPSDTYTMRICPAERVLIERAALAAGEKKPSRWARRILLREARRMLREARHRARPSLPRWTEDLSP